MIFQTLMMAMRELRRNKMRSFLTMLGIIIGVSAVIALVNIGKAASESVRDQIGKLGQNLLIVSPGAGRRSSSYTPASPFTMADVEAIRSEVRRAKYVAPTAQTSQDLVVGNKNSRSTIIGGTNDYLLTRDYTLASGRKMTDGEVKAGRAVCVIGETVRQNLFGSGDPLGAQMRVGKVSCQVIGLLTAKGQSGMGQDQDDIVIMPLRTVQRRLIGTTDINTIFITAESSASTAVAEQQITDLLRQRRHIAKGADDDFSVRDMQEIAQAVSASTSTMTTLLGAIAAVSLLVGGIGIMNIMLVNVTERTREIGIRLAIGALASDVMLQFLVEAVVLSTLGGLIGMAVGVGTSFAVTHSMGMPFIVEPGTLFLAFGFSAAVGVLFGYLPAHKAARLNPIEALRHE
ncbi:MAG: ABC transporter permease [Sorangiineae bacterium]|nr:ABC transporter permease [Polyangiaceae bacterium]MEB2321351.1 ABC transporter permease [Sorangiineae bacterium]